MFLAVAAKISRVKWATLTALFRYEDGAPGQARGIMALVWQLKTSRLNREHDQDGVEFVLRVAPLRVQTLNNPYD